MINNFLYLFIVITGFFVTFSTFFDGFGLLEFVLSSQEGLLTTAVIVYNNADTEKSKFLSDNKGRAGIYQWTHKDSNKTYVGSAVDLSKRLRYYYSKSFLNRSKYMYICNALLNHGHNAFSLSILEYIDTSNLSSEEARKLILSREQHFLDTLKPIYNINPVAGSRLGTQHSVETRALMSKAKLGENNFNFGKSLSVETKALIGKAMSGKQNPMFDTTRSEEMKAKLSEIHGTTIYIYSPDKITLINSLSSARKAAEEFNVSKDTILRYVRNGKLFKKQWILSISIIFSDKKS